MDLIEVKQPISKPQEIKEVPKEVKSVPEYKAQKVNLSKNIQEYDKKVDRHVETRPVETKPNTEKYLSTAFDPTYNLIGKFIGIDTLHDWKASSDKVIAIVEWARKESKAKDTQDLLKWISNKAREVPSVGHAKILDQLYLFARLSKDK